MKCLSILNAANEITYSRINFRLEAKVIFAPTINDVEKSSIRSRCNYQCIAGMYSRDL